MDGRRPGAGLGFFTYLMTRIGKQAPAWVAAPEIVLALSLYRGLACYGEIPHGAFFLCLTGLICALTDIFAYLVGSRFGRRKLAPKVSPKKTVEGAIGGLLGGVIGMTVFKLVADSMAHTLTVYPPIEMAAGPQISWGAVFALGIIGSTISQIGDLSFSVIKREFGVKDYGNLLPGHGGILDRFDSVTFVAPFVWLALQLL